MTFGKKCSRRNLGKATQVIRAFARMRELLLTYKDLLLELEKLRNTSKKHAGKIAVNFKYLKQMEHRQEKTELLEEIRYKPRPVVGCKTGKKRK